MVVVAQLLVSVALLVQVMVEDQAKAAVAILLAVVAVVLTVRVLEEMEI